MNDEKISDIWKEHMMKFTGKIKQETLRSGFVVGLVLLGTIMFSPPILQAETHESKTGAEPYPVSAAMESEAQTEIERATEGKPLLGVYLDDLDFEEVYKKHYEENYGVLVDGLVDGGAAEKAGLMEGDIIMEFDGEKVRHEDHLVRLIRMHSANDRVEIKYFRDGKIYETEAVLQGREEDKKGEEDRAGRPHPGSGGITLYTAWIEPDHTPISNLLGAMGFGDVLSDAPLGDFDSRGFLTRGIQLQFDTGNKWYWGLNFNRYKTSRRADVSTRLKYEFGYWGFSMDRRIGVFDFLILSGGIMAGLGSYDIEILETNETYRWDDLNEQLNDGVNNFVHLQKKYLLAQPNLGLVIRFTDNLGIQGKVGYLISHSYHTGWNARVVGDKFEVENSPETRVEGPTYSVGLWFDIF